MNINNKPCPCHSDKKYKKCCRPFHTNAKVAATPVELLRSRYSAYALGVAEYIMDTTHPMNEDAKKPRQQRESELELFAKGTSFDALEVLDKGDYEASEQVAPDAEKEAWVRFKVTLEQKGHDASFSEKSRFIKEDGRWRYALAEELVDSEDADKSTSEIQTN